VPDTHFRRVNNLETLIHDAKFHVKPLGAVKELFVISAGFLKNFATKSRSPFPKMVGLEFSLSEFLPIAWVAPVTQAKFPSVWFANLEGDNVNVGLMIKDLHEFTQLDRGQKTGVVVEDYQDIAGRRINSHVAGYTGTAVFRKLDELDVNLAPENSVLKIVFGMVVHNDDFLILVILAQN
jgi:hypothetical protein